MNNIQLRCDDIVELKLDRVKTCFINLLQIYYCQYEEVITHLAKHLYRVQYSKSPLLHQTLAYHSTFLSHYHHQIHRVRRDTLRLYALNEERRQTCHNLHARR